jgi:hypothetical protein
MISAMSLRPSSIAFAPALALTIALAASAPAAAQTMEFGCPDPGTTFTFDSGTSVVARGRDGMDCTMEIVGGGPFKVRALLIANPSPDGADTSAYIAALRPERLWPLAVGKTAEASFSAGGRTWRYVLSVARYEKRTGPGDAMIDTFVIEMNEQGDQGQRSISRWWVSPADKYVIRFDYSDSTGKANRAVVTTVKR